MLSPRQSLSLLQEETCMRIVCFCASRAWFVASCGCHVPSTSLPRPLKPQPHDLVIPCQLSINEAKHVENLRQERRCSSANALRNMQPIRRTWWMQREVGGSEVYCTIYGTSKGAWPSTGIGLLQLSLSRLVHSMDISVMALFSS